MKKVIIFDLDGTLAPSKSELDNEMADLLLRLLEKTKVVVVSGGAFKQFQKQFINNMPSSSQSFQNLILMPASGSQLSVWRGNEWKQEYSEKLTKDEKEKIIGALEAAIDEAGLEAPDIVYGPPIIEDRETQITFSDFGQGAPLEVKSRWDPDHKKREKVASILKGKIPEFAVNIGGATSLDITRHGIDKSYAIHKIQKYLNVPIEEMVFVGDALYPGGNDYPAISTGIECVNVKDPEETKALLKSWLG